MKLSIYNLHPEEEQSDKCIEKAALAWDNLSGKTDIPYFLSWSWIKNWLETLPKNLNIRLVVLYEEDNPVCAFFIGERQILRKRIFKSHSIFLNNTGFPCYDALCIEYNRILSGPSREALFAKALKELNIKWDELHLPAMDKVAFSALTEQLQSYNVIIDEEDSSYFVDLEKIPKTIDGYLSLLSSNTRSQIRRSYRAYNEIGEISIAVADNYETATKIFDELIFLHQESWQKRGEPGVFSSEYFTNFHRTLIRNRFSSGEIQLVKITAGNETLGCLYNFVYDDVVYYYQGGIKYKTNPRLKPGFVSHTEAILYNARLGNKVYDFLAGEAQYKKSLSTGEKSLIWARIQKPRVKFQIENWLRKIKRKII